MSSRSVILSCSATLSTRTPLAGRAAIAPETGLTRPGDPGQRICPEDGRNSHGARVSARALPVKVLRSQHTTNGNAALSSSSSNRCLVSNLSVSSYTTTKDDEHPTFSAKELKTEPFPLKIEPVGTPAGLPRRAQTTSLRLSAHCLP
jgi:hypothetical protein